MRFVFLLSMLVLAGCAVEHRARVLTLGDTGRPVTNCYVQRTNGPTIVNAHVARIRDHWMVMGSVRGEWSGPAHHRLLRVEAVDTEEWIVFDYVDGVNLSVAKLGSPDSRQWMFELPIPDPTSFDHLHLGIVAPKKAFHKLPGHRARN